MAGKIAGEEYAVGGGIVWEEVETGRGCVVRWNSIIDFNVRAKHSIELVVF